MKFKHKKASILGKKILIYLTIFCVTILAFLWFFQVIFLNTFYEWVKTKEIENIASKIANAYNSDDSNEDSQEESGLKDLQSFMTARPGASASFEVPDVLSENHGSVSKSINQGQNLLDDEKEGNVTGDKDYDTITLSSDDDLGVLGLLVSILLCILFLI